MDIPFREGVSEKEMDRMRLKLNRVIFADLLEDVVVTEKVQLKPNRARVIELKFQFLPYKNYKQNFGIKPGEVLAYFENKFIIKVLMPVLAGVTKEKKVLVETGMDTDMKTKRSGKGDEDGGETDKNQERAADTGMGEHESSDEMEGRQTRTRRGPRILGWGSTRAATRWRGDRQEPGEGRGYWDGGAREQR